MGAKTISGGRLMGLATDCADGIRGRPDTIYLLANVHQLGAILLADIPC